MILSSTFTCRVGEFSSVLVLITLLLIFESTIALNSENSFKNETSKNSPRDAYDDAESMSTVIWGISLGITAALALIISLSCVYCSCCPMYRRRQRNRPVTFQQQQQFPMTQQNLVYSYDSSGNLVLLNQQYHMSNMTVSPVGSQTQMTATTNFYNPPHEATVPPSYDTATATAPPQSGR